MTSKRDTTKPTPEPASASRTPTRRPTIRDIAKAADVSTATVSHVFSGSRPVSPEAERRVLDIAEQLGYMPNSTARGLASGRAYVVALRVPFSHDDVVYNPYLASSIVTISTALAEHSYATLMLPESSAEASATTGALIRSGRIDATLMLDPSPGDDVIADELEAAGLPVVTVGKLPTRPDIPWVDGDIPAQALDALLHLTERGYNRPAIITFPGDQSYFRETNATYRGWCDERGFPPIIYTTSGITDDSSERCVEYLLSSDFDSYLCADDLFALSVRRRLHDLGHTEIGVIGTGNSRPAAEAVPGLTSLATNAVERGRRAVTLLVDLLSVSELSETQIVIPHELIVRNSTPGPAATAPPERQRKE